MMFLFAFCVVVNLYFAYVVHATRMRILEEVVRMSAALSAPEPNLKCVEDGVIKLKRIVSIE